MKSQNCLMTTCIKQCLFLCYVYVQCIFICVILLVCILVKINLISISNYDLRHFLEALCIATAYPFGAPEITPLPLF
jgi:hypothetical protein